MSISLGGRDYAKKGQPVVIELTSLDVPTGFNAPNFHACTGIVPGAVSRVSFTPNRDRRAYFPVQRLLRRVT